MKKLLFAVSSVLTLGLFAAPLRIMPLGDSITYGQGWDPHGGYRAVLREKLVEAGYDIDYVGTQTANAGTLSTSGDIQHEGHPGWTVDRVQNAFAEWSSKIDAPNIILLKIGTNNCNNDHTQLMGQIGTLLDTIKRLQPSAHVICGTLITFLNGKEVGSNDAWVQAHNDLLKAEVARRAAAGDKISLADLYPVVSPTTGMADDRHPNQEGYRAMADVWFEAIKAVEPDPTAEPAEPDLTAVLCTMDETNADRFTIAFNGQVGESAANLANYSFGGTFAPAEAVLAEDSRSVEIRGNKPVQAGVTYTVSISGVKSASGTKTVVPASFDFRHLPYGAKYYVPEAALYRKVYAFTFPDACGYDTVEPTYDFDDHLAVGKFTRVAYYIELQRQGGEMQYVWASMDAFTDDAGRIAIPTKFALSEEKEIFQQRVANMKVWSNVAGVTGGGTVRNGNIEFWPYSYFGTPKLGLEGATGSYDFDDSCNLTGNFACMQIHDTDNRTPLFCFNNWGTGGGYDLGLGARPGSSNIDWTQSNTSNNWNQRRYMEIYVMEDVADTTVPQLLSATLGEDRRTVTVSFDRAIADEPNLKDKVSFSNGTAVKSVVRSADGKSLVITCGYLRQVTGVKVVLDGLHATTPAHTAVARTEVAISGTDDTESYPAAPEAVTSRVPEAAGYAHVFTLDLQPSMRINIKNGTGYVNEIDPDGYAAAHEVNNRAQAPEFFSRVGYLMELTDKSGNVNWVWTAFDAFSGDYGDIDIPTATPEHKDGGYRNGRYVTNLDVKSNVEGIVTGTGIGTGLIEFSPWDYGAGNKRDVPNARGDKYDFGDDLYPKVGAYACMQVHNYAAELADGSVGQVIWALTKFNGQGIGIGIGNSQRSDGQLDYTFDSNGNNYSSRKLYILVKPDDDADASTDYEPVRAVASADGARVAVTFKSAVRETAAQPRYFSLAGATIVSAEVSSLDARDVILTLAEPLADESEYTVETAFPKSTNKAMKFKTLRPLPAALLDGVEEIGQYVLINDLTVGRDDKDCVVQYAKEGADYRTDESRFLTDYKIERIAYALELESKAGGDYQWAWASMDPFTEDLTKIGVPSITRENHFQCFVDNLSVRAGGAASIATGDWPKGNIEFTPSNYSGENSNSDHVLNVPNATSGFDWGDRLYGNGQSAGHGCMQIHNHLASDMVIGVTRLGGMRPSLLIGMRKNADGTVADDGTFNENANQYKTRELRVFVKLAPPPEPASGDKGLGVAFLVEPQDTLVKLMPGQAAQTFTLNAYAPTATRYQWRKNGVDIPGATGPVYTGAVATPSTETYTVVAFLDDENYVTSKPVKVTAVPMGTTVIIR